MHNRYIIILIFSKLIMLANITRCTSLIPRPLPCFQCYTLVCIERDWGEITLYSNNVSIYVNNVILHYVWIDPPLYTLDQELTIPIVVNMIAEISNWQELGICLGLESSDTDVITNDYEPREHRQRLVEKWFSREPERSWEKLQRALDEVNKRRGSQASNCSLPLASPMGMTSV